MTDGSHQWCQWYILVIMDTVVIWSILHFYMTSKYLPQGQVICLWFSASIAHLLEWQMEWTKDMSRSALCYKLSIYCYFMERQSVLDWKSQCTPWSQHSCMQITSHSLSWHLSGSAFYGSPQFAFLGNYNRWGYIPTHTLVQLIKELITSLDINSVLT